MTKELEALKRFRESSSRPGVNVYADEYLDVIEKGLKRLERLEEALKTEIVSEECLWNVARADGKGEKARRHRYCGEALARVLNPDLKDPAKGGDAHGGI